MRSLKANKNCEATSSSTTRLSADRLTLIVVLVTGFPFALVGGTTLGMLPPTARIHAAINNRIKKERE